MQSRCIYAERQRSAPDHRHLAPPLRCTIPSYFDDTCVFQHKIRTEGRVSASSASHSLRKRPRVSPLPEQKRGAYAREDLCEDVPPLGPTPILPAPGQRLVVVDPRRREMIAAVRQKNDGSQWSTVSTKANDHEADIGATMSPCRERMVGLLGRASSHTRSRHGGPERRNRFGATSFATRRWTACVP